VMKMIAALALGAVVAVTGASAEAKDWKKIRIASEGAYAPWNATDANNKLVGFEVDLAADLCKRMKAECEMVAQDWDGVIPALQQGKFDAVMSAMSINEERKKVIAFSTPYAADPSVFVAMKGSPLLTLAAEPKRIDMKTMDDAKKAQLAKTADFFKGKTIGAQVSTIQSSFIEKTMPGLTMRTYDKIDNAGLDLVAGRIDVLLADKSVMVPMTKDGPGKDMTFFGPELIGGIIGDGIGVGLRKKDDDLRKMFDKAIGEAAADGTISKLAVQYFGFDISPKQ
jgi:octopine/nopaline transport system substrate-binding protein